MMRYGSVCSGIEAATVAWQPLGWRPAFFSEIDPFARAVLRHRWPDVPLHGDFTTIEAGQYEPIDLLVGGTPCQSFSIAGLRGGLDDDRGNLALEYLRLAGRLRPRWLVWENVPGVLSSNGGRDFGAILGGMVELWYGFAYRVLDAQHFGVPQRRRRVFVVGYLGDWRPAAAVLFERESLSGHPPPRREAGQGVAAGSLRGTDGGSDVDHARAGHLVAYGGNRQHGPIDVATAVNAHGGPHGRLDFEPETFIAFDTTQITSRTNRSQPRPGAPCHPLATGAHPPAISFHARQDPDSGPVTHPLDTDGHSIGIAHGIARVRRLTPRECERLQGFPDDWTLIPYRGRPAADGPRYRALGNSMAVPVMRWIGRRIDLVTALMEL